MSFPPEVLGKPRNKGIFSLLVPLAYSHIAAPLRGFARFPREMIVTELVR